MTSNGPRQTRVPHDPRGHAVHLALDCNLATLQATRLADTLGAMARGQLSHTGATSRHADAVVEYEARQRPWEDFARLLHERAHPRRVLLLLPSAGDTRGLTAEPSTGLELSLSTDHDHGQAVVWETPRGSIAVSYRGEHEGLTTWHACDMASTTVAIADWRDTTRHLAETVLACEDMLDSLGLRTADATLRAHIADAELRWARGPWTGSVPATRHASMLRAATLALAADLALDDTVTTTRTDVVARRRVMRELDRAARRCLEATVSWH